jgi:para-aminobenzoate synthetase component 1
VKLNFNQTPYVHYQDITGSKPSVILEYKNGLLTLLHAEQSLELNLTASQALEFVSNFVNNLEKPEFDHPIPRSHFQYGLMGFFSFEFGLKLLDIKVKQTKANCPDFYLILPTEYKIKGKKYSVTSETPLSDTPNPQLLKQKTEEKLKSNLTKKQYEQKLEKVKEHLKNGETYQVNFAQEFTTSSKKLAHDLYNEITSNNPSPHDGILHTANFSIISNSPECLYTKTGKSISTFPIKGTLKKDQDPQILLDSKKDQAELEMIVDLERNDLGKIAIPGSVKVSRHRYIESYTNVHHTISQIDALLPKNTDFKNVFEALFPGGSITGCPKIRTSQIIHNLETTPRGCYCGSLGYIDVNGNSQFNILIRTIWMEGSQVSFHSGGGITIQSNPIDEYDETIMKAENLKKAL